MKLEKNENKVLSSNLKKKDVFSSKINNSAIIIDYLRNKIYTDKIKTPVQEYLSNARDAMISVNNKNPIRITLPTGVKQSLVIRDFGPLKII